MPDRVVELSHINNSWNNANGREKKTQDNQWVYVVQIRIAQLYNYTIELLIILRSFQSVQL